MPYHHGARVTEAATGARAFLGASTAVIGLVSTSTDADAATFPMGVPTLVTDVRAAIGKAGAIGELAPSLQAIADQTSPVMVVVRADPGADDATKTANVQAALNALLGAKSLLGVAPKIIGCPGLDTQDVVDTLATVAGKLNGFAYASALNGAGVDTVAEAITYRAEFSARELMLLYPDFKANGATDYAVARALGLRARIDQEQGWNKSLSNVPVNGVSGVSAAVSWDLTDPSTDAGLLNAAQITTLVHAGGGYRFWGSRTCTDDPNFIFEPAVRTAQFLKETIANGLLWAIDKPLHPSLARDIVESINAEFRSLIRSGFILGGKAWIDPSKNDKTQLAAGQLSIDYDYTFTPPMEDLELTQTVTDKYLADFSSQATFS